MSLISTYILLLFEKKKKKMNISLYFMERMDLVRCH